MTNTSLPPTITFLSEIFPLTLSNTNISCFRLNHEVEREVGNRFSWRFSEKFADIITIWQEGYFWILAKPNLIIPNQNEWREALLDIADYFMAIDISRSSKKKLAGSRNACASVRLYGNRGEFIRYRIEDALIEGEEIPRIILEKFLPQAELKNKTVLIYRDGRFQGEEVNHLLARAKAINAKLILVECCKSGNPRLYNFYQQLAAPSRGLALGLSSREAILVTTQVLDNIGDKIGVPRPLRLKIHEKGEPASLKKLVEATLKLTLLHYGSLKDPRLPVCLYGSDIIAYRRLQGIYPGSLEGDRQSWL